MRHKPHPHLLAVLIRIVTVLALLFLPSISHPANGQEPTQTTIDFDSASVPADLRHAIERAVIDRPPDLLRGSRLAVVSLVEAGDWALGTLAQIDNAPEAVGMGELGALVILRRQVDGWSAGVEGTTQFESLIRDAPVELLDPRAKKTVSPSSLGAQATQEEELKFPWDSSQEWWLTSDAWHEGSANDFAPSSGEPNMWVLAAHDGVVTHVCSIGAVTANIEIEHNGVRTLYAHLDKNTVSPTIQGTWVSRGQVLGLLYRGVYNAGPCGDTCTSGAWSCVYRDGCGCGTGPHIHFGLPSQNVTIDGWTSNSSNVWTKGNERKQPGASFPSSNQRIGNAFLPCPSSADVTLYRDANFVCANMGESAGYVQRNGTGFQNVPGSFNDQASSMRIRSGWSVKLYQHTDGKGGAACRNGDDSSFGGDAFSNGVSLNDQVSSFEVFSAPDCTVPPPAPPTLLSPPDGYTAADNRAPALCWSNPGGDALQFHAEVYNSPANADSDWISGTCWQPSALNGKLNSYQWHVKTKNSQGAESAWSPTWRFRIEAPDLPPTISFDAATGITDDQIISRMQSWTFTGTAGDPEGRLERVEFRCSGENCGTVGSHTNGESWRHTQNDMAGQNDVFFVAYDAAGQATASRHLDLHIDLASPTTTGSLNGEANAAHWPTWFTVPVQTRFDAADNGTGRAVSGVLDVYYRLDGGGWQKQAGSTATLGVTEDGPHTVEYFAVDNAGNVESTHSAAFWIDKTAPGPPLGATETHGAPHDAWQKANNTPTFTWAPASDAASGVWGYQLYFGPDPAGVSYLAFLASSPLQWTPQPGGVRTGTSYLRGRTRDNAGNWSAWATLFTFRYDGTPPENPSGIRHAAGIANDTWQRTSNWADFSWPTPHDEGSGVKGYYIYWGADQDGTSDEFITSNAYELPVELCAPETACTGYLRLRSLDKVDNAANDWTTAFTLRYDDAAPTADFAFAEGITTTQTLVHLQITADDQGSGVREMRLSGDGQNWVPWEVYATERLWLIPAISRQWWPVYLEVRDGVGLASEVVSHTIYLDVNAQQPRSASYRLFDHVLSTGAGEHNSTLYRGRSTVGQPVDSTGANSVHFTLVGGYEAGSQAIPIEDPGHDEFRLVNGIFASGTGATTLSSRTYSMAGTVGELGLPNNETTLASQNHRHQPGFLAAVQSVATPAPTPVPGPTPAPTPTPPCPDPSVMINGDAPFTRSLDVSLGLCAPWATEMRISSHDDFAGATWEPYASSKAWTLSAAGQNVQPCFVYAAFKDGQGMVYSNYFDDIIYDTNPPAGSLATAEAATPVAPGGAAAAGVSAVSQPLKVAAAREHGTVDLYITAQDDNSGLAEMQISVNSAFTDTTWEPYSALAPWTPEGGDGTKTVYARFRDSAGNVSAVAETSFAVDTLGPFGSVALGTHVVGPDAITTTVYLGAEDNLSGVSDMRVGADPAFSDVAWQPYTLTLTWPLAAPAGSKGTLYAQYRDLAGNVSNVFSDTYMVDMEPPVVYAEVEPGRTVSRIVDILAYDALTSLAAMRLSNDPTMVEDVVTAPFTSSVQWEFDDRRVVWVQVSDATGNWAEPYPAYAAPVYSPQAPVVTISLDGENPVLSWSHAEVNAYYQIWRGAAPHFAPAPGTDAVKLDDVWPLGDPTMTYTDMSAERDKTYYYVIVAVNALEESSEPGDVQGVFRFSLIGGQ